MQTLEVLVPVAGTRVHAHPLAPRLSRLDGRRIGWLDNMKANAGELLRQVAATLQSSAPGFEIVLAAKNATAAAPDTVMAHLRTCDAVVMAIAD